MTFDEIMAEITKGLTGDNQKDLTYLEEQMQKYKDHEYGKEIARACGRIIYENMPEETKQKFANTIEKDNLHIDATLEEVRFNIYKHDYDKAEKIMSSLVESIDKCEEAGMYQNDAVSEYYTFDEPFEEILFHELNKPQKDVRRSGIAYAEIYLLYGSLLIDLKKYEEANRELEKAVRWNPTSAKISFEYAETYKIMGNMDRFFEISKNIFSFAFKPEDVARCYRNLAFYFVEKEQWSEAIACNLMSMQFDHENKNVQAELYYIDQITNGKIKEPSMTDLKAYSKKYGFPVGVDSRILQIAYAYGKHYFDWKKYEPAIYFLSIVYSLTEDEDIKTMLDQIQEGD